ncbi:uncharacterized protein [Salminus brasiliensis]|uniref:uncharacterized protein n=1 Tax=Salminus brasiliensis TaxID=930266 RepID=UPI003B837FDD
MAPRVPSQVTSAPSTPGQVTSAAPSASQVCCPSVHEDRALRAGPCDGVLRVGSGICYDALRVSTRDDDAHRVDYRAWDPQDSACLSNQGAPSQAKAVPIAPRQVTSASSAHPLKPRSSPTFVKCFTKIKGATEERSDITKHVYSPLKTSYFMTPHKFSHDEGHTGAHRALSSKGGAHRAPSQVTSVSSAPSNVKLAPRTRPRKQTSPVTQRRGSFMCPESITWSSAVPVNEPMEVGVCHLTPTSAPEVHGPRSLPRVSATVAVPSSSAPVKATPSALVQVPAALAAPVEVKATPSTPSQVIPAPIAPSQAKATPIAPSQVTEAPIANSSRRPARPVTEAHPVKSRQWPRPPLKSAAPVSTKTAPSASTSSASVHATTMPTTSIIEPETPRIVPAWGTDHRPLWEGRSRLKPKTPRPCSKLYCHARASVGRYTLSQAKAAPQSSHFGVQRALRPQVDAPHAQFTVMPTPPRPPASPRERKLQEYLPVPHTRTQRNKGNVGGAALLIAQINNIMTQHAAVFILINMDSPPAHADGNRRAVLTLQKKRQNNVVGDSSPLSEDQFQCSICLDVFTDPVSTPCGHNFCTTCLTQYWNNTQHCHCPLCKETFTKRPELKINTTLREIADHFKKKSVLDRPEVLCEACSGMKLKALKSCLDCGVTFCKSHLEPHYKVPRLKEHKLIDPVENVEDYICQKHKKPLQLFCRDDQTCVCQFCTEGAHRAHNIVPIEEESGQKKTQLGKTQTDVQQMIQYRLKKIKEIKQTVALRKRNTEKEITDSVEVFTALIRSIERSQAELLEVMKERQKAAETQAEDLIKELEQEITELKRRDTELEQLSHTEDHLHLLQFYPSLCSPLHTKNWTDLSIYPHLSVEPVRSALSELQKSLDEKLSITLNEKMKESVSTELKMIQQYAVDVTLDPDTASPSLILSADGKQVTHGNIKQNLPANLERFNKCPCVLGKEGFSSGRFYYEVQVSGKTDWDLGVARESVNRKVKITLTPQNGFWTVWLRKENEYKALTGPSVLLSLRKKPQKVGVFVDYEEGLVSFYDVEARSHIYSFTGQSFTEKLYPYFCPFLNDGGKNSAPLIISPVCKTD